MAEAPRRKKKGSVKKKMSKRTSIPQLSEPADEESVPTVTLENVESGLTSSPGPSEATSTRQGTPTRERTPTREGTPVRRGTQVHQSRIDLQPEEQTKDFRSLDPKDYDVEMGEEEMKYEPPTRDGELPDLYRLLDSLDDGDTELETRGAPPALFTRPEHVTKYKKISELRTEMEQEEIDPYLKNFEDGIRDDVLMVGSIGLEEIQEEERQLRDDHVTYQEQEAELARIRQERLMLREEEAKRRMAVFVREQRLDIARREELLRQKEKLLMDRLHKSFCRAEDQLMGSLEFRKGEVKTLYGDLTVADGVYGGSRGRRWKVDWDRSPQPVQVKLKCLRGVKDKLPGGRYVLMASLYNRLGGHTMRWSKLKGQQWSGATIPTFHEGHFYNVEMKFDQNVFTVLPSKPSLRPGMVLVFELFLLRGSVVQTDRVVGWGCFPICDGQFDVIEGKYKCPLLRGEMDPQIQTHDTIEKLLSSDIDHWLANLYFDIVKLPRYMGGQKEYEVELHFSSALTSFPDRVRIGWEVYKDGEKPEPGSQDSLNYDNPSPSGSSISLPSTSTLTMTAKSDATAGKVRLSEKTKQDHLGKKGKAPTYNSRLWHQDKKLKLEDSSDEEDMNDEYDKITRREKEFKPVDGAPGMYYKKHLYSPQDRYYRDMFAMLPKSRVLDHKERKKPLTHIEQLEQHTFAVQPPFSCKGRMAEPGNEKIMYIGKQFLAELGLSQWRSREFWGMMLIFILIFFLRMYLHYVAQWAFLQAATIPVNRFEFYAYTVNLNYQSSLLTTGQEIALVIFGPIMNILVFTLLVIICWLLRKIVGFFPDIFYKFVIGYGIMTFLDPLLILIVDCIVKRYENLGGTEPIADFAKLWWHFERSQGSGMSGVFITAFLYLCTAFFTASILYMYFLRQHNGGRLLDVFWRLHGAADQFFVPYDLEVSNQELNYILKKAEQWRGEEGERRKTAVYDYIWEEEDEAENAWSRKDQPEMAEEEKSSRREITTHVSIHTVHLDGLRELYRHFLRLPDGTVVEVFGEVNIPGMDKDMTSALEKGSKDLEKLLALQTGSKGRGKKRTGSATASTSSGGSGFHTGSTDSAKKVK